MNQSTKLSAVVNNQPVTRVVPNRMTLAEFIRDELGLRGTKLSCEVQVCGACTVIVDGRPASSCTFLAVDIDGREVVTIEGCAEGEQFNHVQSALIRRGAIQCGFCTPGFVLTIGHLLSVDPRPSLNEVYESLEGNICRCTGYVQLRQAVADLVSEGNEREVEDGR